MASLLLELIDTNGLLLPLDWNQMGQQVSGELFSRPMNTEDGWHPIFY
jgi:hypothetical protein